MATTVFDEHYLVDTVVLDMFQDNYDAFDRYKECGIAERYYKHMKEQTKGDNFYSHWLDLYVKYTSHAIWRAFNAVGSKDTYKMQDKFLKLVYGHLQTA